MDLNPYYLEGAIPSEISAMLQLTGDNISLESMWTFMDFA